MSRRRWQLVGGAVLLLVLVPVVESFLPTAGELSLFTGSAVGFALVRFWRGDRRIGGGPAG